MLLPYWHQYMTLRTHWWWRTYIEKSKLKMAFLSIYFFQIVVYREQMITCSLKNSLFVTENTQKKLKNSDAQLISQNFNIMPKNYLINIFFCNSILFNSSLRKQTCLNTFTVEYESKEPQSPKHVRQTQLLIFHKKYANFHLSWKWWSSLQLFFFIYSLHK